MKLRKGDTVQIMKGKDAGKSGKIIRVVEESGKLVVEGLNLFKKHVRPKRQGEKGEIVQISRPLQSSNVMVLCGSCKKPTRIAMKIENDKKFRVCKKCGAKF